MANTTPRRLAGVSSIMIDGSSYALVDGLIYSAAVVKRETLMGLDGVHGYKETPVAGYIACTIRDTGVRVEDFNAMSGVTVQASQANGKQIVGYNMWTADVQEVNAVEGTFEVRFEGPDVTESF